MNTSLYISRKLFFDRSNRNFLSQRIIRIALFGISLGMAAMIISVAVITGFKREIAAKVVGFQSNIQVMNFDSGNTFESMPISKNQSWIPNVKSLPGVKNIDYFATKPGMIKTNLDNYGIVFKGVGAGYNWNFIRKNLVAGNLPVISDSARSNSIVISEQIAKLLKIETGHKIILVFIQTLENSPILLQAEVCGIYRTGLEDFDNLYVFGDLKQIQRANNWSNNQISGFEIEIENFWDVFITEQKVRDLVINYDEKSETTLRTQNIVSANPQIFDWLRVTDMNVWILLSLISLVAGFSMASGLLVLILERSNMIGILKAMGFSNRNVRKVFIYVSVFMTTKGLMIGNLIGLTFIFLQKHFHLVKLDPTTYYMEYMPVNFSLLHLVLLNVATIILISAMLIIPSYMVSRISPDKSILFD